MTRLDLPGIKDPASIALGVIASEILVQASPSPQGDKPECSTRNKTKTDNYVKLL